MAAMESPALEELELIDFTLKNIDGGDVSLGDIRGEKGTLIMFICNHCPYVMAVIERLVVDCKALKDKGIGCVAIMSNDTQSYPADSFDNMKLFAAEHGFTFPYLIDETQDVAKSYDAACTPDFFGFSANGMLAYRGRIDSAGKNEADENTTRELLNAMIEIGETGKCTAPQVPSMGCSIKWR